MSYSEVFKLNFRDFEKQVLKNHPILKEKKLEINKSKNRKKKVHSDFWLRTLRLRLVSGPVPALKQTKDSMFVYSPTGLTDSYLLQNFNDYDFNRWGVFYGLEATLVQPLNFLRYNTGLNAAQKNIKIKKVEFKKEKNIISVQAQKSYFGLLLLQTLLDDVNNAYKQLNKAQERIEENLEEDKDDFSQNDLLEIIANRYKLEKARNKVQRKYTYALQAVYFILDFKKGDSLVLKDKYLTKSNMKISSYESLQKLMLIHHPDLQRLRLGLSARQDLVEIAKSEQFFDFFIFASSNLVRTFGGDVEVVEGNPFVENPFNQTTAAIGIGAQIDLNFWKNIQKVRYEKIELQQLRRQEDYAKRGLFLSLKEAYLKYQESKKNMKSAKRSFKARKSLLQSVGLDASLEEVVDLSKFIGPYTRNLEAKKDYYQAIFDYNLSIAILVQEVGLSLSDVKDKI